ncbi:MAG: hypothetical protein ACLPXB_13445 [Thiobacillaceae bacterium]
MTRKTTGTYGFKVSRTFDPELLLSFHDNTPSLTDAAIVEQARYVAANDPDLPSDWVPPTDLAGVAARRPGFRVRIALWPDHVYAVIYFSIFQFEPRPETLICAYHYARQIQQAMKLQHCADEGGAQ